MNSTSRILTVGAVALCLGLPTLSQAEGPSPEKVRELKTRFQEGYAIFARDKDYKKALTIFEGIIAEAPEARGSLLFGGLSLNELGQYEKALSYFERFKKLEPGDAAGVIGSIRAHQSLGNEEKAEALISELRKLKEHGKDRNLPFMRNFERERIPTGDGGFISALEYFELKEEKPVWAFVRFDKEMKPVERYELVEGSERASAAIKGDQKAYFFQKVTEPGTPDGTKILKQHKGKPAYSTVRAWAMESMPPRTTGP